MASLLIQSQCLDNDIHPTPHEEGAREYEDPARGTIFRDSIGIERYQRAFPENTIITISLTMGIKYFEVELTSAVCPKLLK